MGNALRPLLKKTTKPIREYNLENRIDKIITKNKPTPAPYHPGTEQLFKKANNQEVKKKLLEKDKELLKRLEQVYVTSYDAEVPLHPQSSRPLPTSRECLEDPIYGYHEPKRIPYGKTTLKKALEFLAKHQESPEEWNATKIALTYKLEDKNTENILKYFNTFVLVMPEETAKEKITISEEFLGKRSVVRLPITAGNKLEVSKIKLKDSTES